MRTKVMAVIEAPGWPLDGLEVAFSTDRYEQPPYTVTAEELVDGEHVEVTYRLARVDRHGMHVYRRQALLPHRV